MMAHITEFTVEGLAGRKKPYSQTLNRDVNVFFGLNGSGKTSLLKILHSAMELDTAILKNVPFRSAEVKVFSQESKLVYTHTFTYEDKQKLVSQDIKYARYVVEEGEVRVAQVGTANWKLKPSRKDIDRWAHRYLPTSRIWNAPLQSHNAYGYAGASSLTEDQLDAHFQQTLERLWAGYIRDILTTVRKAQEEGLANILKGIVTAEKAKGESLDSETAYKRAKTFLTRQGAQAALGSLEEFDKRYSRNATLKNVVSYINEVESRIDEATAPRDNLQNLIGRLFSGSKKVSFTDKSIEITTEDKSQISLASLSSGEKHVLRILIECLYAGDNSIIIDEPEISMHVDWQKDLISAMRSINNEAQLILATHSPEVMSTIDDDKIFRL